MEGLRGTTGGCSSCWPESLLFPTRPHGASEFLQKIIYFFMFLFFIFVCNNEDEDIICLCFGRFVHETARRT